MRRLRHPDLRARVRLYALVAVLFLFPRVSDAADPITRATETVSLFGLSFPCRACEVTVHPDCRITFYQSDKITGCREALVQLLEKAAASETPSEHPSAAELRRFLTSEKQAADVSTPALRLLLKSEAGRQVLTQETYAFAGPYSDVLASLVTPKPEERPVWLAFWKLPAREGVEVGTRLRAEIFSQIQSLTADDLFTDMTIVRPEQDIAELAVYEAALTEKRPQIAQDIHAVRSFLAECNVVHSATEHCDKSSLRLSSAAATFLEKIQLQRLTRAFGDGKLGIMDFVERLKAVDYRRARTPALHSAVVKALAGASDERANDVRAKITGPGYRPMFEEFSRNDMIIANRWAILLCRRASELFQAAQFDESLQLLEASYVAVDHPLAERVEFLREAADSPAWAADAELRSRFKEAVNREESPAPWYVLDSSTLSWMVALLIFFAAAWIGYVYRFRRESVAQEHSGLASQLTAFADREELQTLLDFFELSANAGEAELTKSYRRKAKETHPDLSRTSSVQFNELQEKFRRARELILRRTKSG